MKVKVKETLVINKDILSDALDVYISSMTYENSYFRLVSHKNYATIKDKEVIIYLRCSDLKGVLGLDINVFDLETPKFNKKSGNYTFKYERTVLQKKFNFRRLKNTLKKHLGA